MPEACDRLRRLLRTAHRVVLVETTDEAHAMDVIRCAARLEKRQLLLWSCARGVHTRELDPGDVDGATVTPQVALAELSRRLGEHSVATGGKGPPALVVLLDLADHYGPDPSVLRRLRELIADADRAGACLVLVDHSDDHPAPIRDAGVALDLPLPNDDELVELIRRTVRAHHSSAKPIRATLAPAELELFVRNLRGLTRRQSERVLADSILLDRELAPDDLNTILAEKRREVERLGLLQFVEAPVSLDSVGGLWTLKLWLARRENSLDEAARSFGIVPPRGVLLLGVQGAGKSLCAKAIATAWKRPLLRLDVGALYDKYIGETEKRLSAALRQTERMAPLVLWIDEIEKAFASAASQSTDGGLSRRVFGTLLTWMQEHEVPVFLVATANDIGALPPELLRKGRFDEIFFVDLPGEDARRAIVEIHLRKRKRDPEMYDIDEIVNASTGYSGAEIEQAILSALHGAYAEGGRPLLTRDVVGALRDSPPLSVTMAERVAALRAWAASRCVPAEGARPV